MKMYVNCLGAVEGFFARHRKILIKLGLLFLAFLVFGLWVRKVTTDRLEEHWRQEVVMARITAEQETTERLRQEYNVAYHEERKTQAESDATMIAKMLYPYQYNSDDGLRSAVWCVLNRVDNRQYPDTVDGVCSQTAQFMGWSDDNPVIERLYNLAFGEVTRWNDGVRPMSADYVYMEWTNKAITLRTTYDGGRGCHYWYEEDWDE